MEAVSELSNLTPVVAVVLLFLVFLWKLGGVFVTALNNLTESNRDIATQTKELKEEAKKGNTEAKQRNGHLAELVTKTATHTQKLADRNLKELMKIKEQHIQTQVIDTSVVAHQVPERRKKKR